MIQYKVPRGHDFLILITSKLYAALAEVKIDKNQCSSWQELNLVDTFREENVEIV